MQREESGFEQGYRMEREDEWKRMRDAGRKAMVDDGETIMNTTQTHRQSRKSIYSIGRRQADE
jgi:hypothetical protein